MDNGEFVRMDWFECRSLVCRIFHKVGEAIDTEKKAGTSGEGQFLENEVEDWRSGFAVLRAEMSKARK